jgi:5-methylcytosine-specific restriction endonuclease McrA
MRTELEKESKEWAAKPFSFSPSPAFGELLKNRQTLWANGSRKKPEAKACMCQNCGSVIVVGKARNYRENAQPEVYCDKECSYADRGRVYRMRKIADKAVLSKGLIPKSIASKAVFCDCLHCKRRFTATESRQFCTSECTKGYRDAIAKANRLQWAIERIERQKKNAKLQSCKQCGIQYTSLREGGTLYCSQRCVSKYAKKNRHHIARSSRKIGGGFSDVDVFKAAKWKCKICGIKVHQATGQHSETQATIDHIVPMSRGGLHVWGNVQCACQRCNASKSDKIERPVQMTFL